LGSASEVYQTTLPSFRAASTRRSSAEDAAAAVRAPVTASTPRSVERFLMPCPLLSRCESLHEAAEASGCGERVHVADHPGRLLVRHDEAGVATELRLQLVARHRRRSAPPRVILALLEDPPVVEPDPDVPDELPRIVDGRIE